MGVLAVTFTKKAAGEMRGRLEGLLGEQMELDGGPSGGGEPREGQGGDGPDDDGGAIVQEEVAGEGRRREGPPPQMDRVTLGTFHSVCAKILRWNGAELAELPRVRAAAAGGGGGGGGGPTSSSSSVPPVPLDGSFAIVDQSDQMRILKDCLRQCGIDLKEEGGGGGGAAIRPITVLNAVGQLRAEDADSALDLDGGVLGGGAPSGGGGATKMSRKVRRIAEAVYPRYTRELLRNNSLDFDDLILLARDLLHSRPDVRDRLRRRWAHVLVDEFQDTSRAQLDLVKLLTTDSLLVVGDGDQSIYSWRGAYAESMADFAAEFGGAASSTEAAGVETCFLMENYRSTTNIVRAAQRVINDPKGGGSRSRTAEASVRQDMKPMRPRGPNPRVLACADAKAEAARVVGIVHEMVGGGELTPESTVAFIYRTNSQSRALEEECVSQNLRYLVRGSAGTFYSRAEIKDCLCFLRVLYNSRDRSGMMRAFKTPSRGIGDVAMNEFFAYCAEVDSCLAGSDPSEPGPTPLDVLISLVGEEDGSNGTFPPPDGIISKRALNRFLPFAAQMKSIRQKAGTATVAELLSHVVEDLDLRSHFDSISKTSTEFSDRMNNVMELLNAAERYNDDGPGLSGGKGEDGLSPMGQFLDDVALLTETESESENSLEPSEKRVVANLMTIHASKGMEFDAVFLVGNEEGTFPTQRSISEGEGSVELEEERRLCYVAMTRAKTHLILSWRREVMTFYGQNQGGFKYLNPERSRFLDVLMASSSAKRKEKEKMSGSPPSMPSREGARRVSGSNEFSSRQRKGKFVRDDASYVARQVASGRSVKDRRGPTASTDIRNSPQGGSWNDWKPVSVRNAEGQRRSTRGSLKKNVATSRRPKQKRVARPARMKPPSGRSFDESRRGEVPKNDSTLFFDVGSRVVHNVHGEGKVLPPPETSDGPKLLVRIEFDDGYELDLPVGDVRHKF